MLITKKGIEAEYFPSVVGGVASAAVGLTIVLFVFSLRQWLSCVVVIFVLFCVYV